MSSKTFCIGQTVKWRSQAGGTWKDKQGEVVHVVKIGAACPSPKWLANRYSASAAPINAGWPRDHESYIVKVPGKTSTSKPLLYWPRVSALELVPKF